MKAIVLIFFVLSFNFCKGQTNYVNKDIEHEIINSVLLDYIGINPLVHFPPPPPIIPNATKKDSIEFEKYLESYKIDKEKFKAKRKVILINDSLIDFKDKRFEELYMENKTEFSLDSVFESLLVSLTTKKHERKFLDLRLIDNQGVYEFKYYSKKDSLIGNYTTIARINISRIEINEKADKACFYIGFSCGRLCGYGKIIYVSKNENDKWEIVDSDEIWVS